MLTSIQIPVLSRLDFRRLEQTHARPIKVLILFQQPNEATVAD